MRKPWYVEVRRTDVRFGYVNAEDRADAIKRATEVAAGDTDGLVTNIGSWETVEVHPAGALGHHDEDDAPADIKIL